MRAVRLAEPTWDEEEIEAVVEVFRSGRVTSGDRVREFEARFGEHAVMCNSGSSANLLAFAAMTNPKYDAGPLERGDEVIVPALAWATSIWPIVQHGLVPVFVDIDLETLCIDPKRVADACGPRTRAVLGIDVYGNPCDWLALDALAHERGLFLVRDACEALGAAMPASPEITFTTYSFYFSHHITTLEGGMCVARWYGDAELLRVLRAHGWVRDMRESRFDVAAHPHLDSKFLFVNVGYNLRASEVAAAMGLVQERKLAQFVRARKRVAAGLQRAVHPYAEVLRTQHEHSHQGTVAGSTSSWFGFPIVVEDDAPFEPAALRMALEAAGIETRSIIAGNITRQPAMEMCEYRVVGTLDESDAVMDRGFSIGCHQAMTDADVAYVAETLDAFMRRWV